MRWAICSLIMLSITGVVRAQEVKPDPTGLLKETEQKLKDAQDRKAQLADENARLAAQIADLQKTNKAQAAQIDDLKTQVAGFTDKTLFLSTHYAAWKQFITANPAIKVQWEIFQRVTSAFATQPPFFIDPEWPLPQDQ
jgi:septal ring factor EnvC (AmiA/AmiB activator)